MKTTEIKKADYFAARTTEEKLAIHLTWMMIRKAVDNPLTSQEKYRTKKHLANLFKNHPSLVDDFKQLALRAVLPSFLESMHQGMHQSLAKAARGMVKVIIQ